MTPTSANDYGIKKENDREENWKWGQTLYLYIRKHNGPQMLRKS
jgi:hypothetical protein